MKGPSEGSAQEASVILTRAAASLLACALLSSPAAAGPPHSHATEAPPRTAWGQPSLEGLWASNNLLVLEATAKTPKLVVPEAEAKVLAAAAAEQEAAGFER